MARIKLFKKQLEAYKLLSDKDKTNIVVYGGGARGGKSHLGCVWIVTMCLAYPNSKWLIGFESLKHLRRTTMPDLLKVIKLILSQNGCKKWDKLFLLNQMDMTITFINGSIIYLAELATLPSDPEFDRLGSYSLTGFWIDEVQRVDKKAVDTLFSRLSLTQEKGWSFKAKGLLTCNPTKGFIYRDFWKPIVKEEKEFIEVKSGNESVFRYFITSLYLDNPYIDHAQYRSAVLQTNNKVQIERLLNGNFEYDDNINKLFDYDCLLNMFVQREREHGQHYITCDVATSGDDKAIIYLWENWHIKEIKVFAKSTLPELQACIEEMRQKYNVLKTQVLVDDGGVGTGLRMYGDYIAFVSNASPITNHIHTVNNYQNLKTQCVDYASKKVNSNEVSITTNINLKDKEELLEELETFERYKIDEDGKFKILPKEKQKEKLGRSPDFADAFIMRSFFDLEPERKLLIF